MKKGKMINPFTIVILAVCVMVAVLVSVYFILSKDKEEETIELTGEPIEEVIVGDVCSDDACSDEDIWVDVEEETIAKDEIEYIGTEKMSVNKDVLIPNIVVDDNGNEKEFENFHKGNTYIVDTINNETETNNLNELIQGEIKGDIETNNFIATEYENVDKVSLYDVCLFINDTLCLNAPIKCVMVGENEHYDTVIYFKDDNIKLSDLLKNIYVDNSRLRELPEVNTKTFIKDINDSNSGYSQLISVFYSEIENTQEYRISIDNYNYIFAEDYCHGAIGENLNELLQGTKEELSEEDIEVMKQYEIYLKDLGALLDTDFMR